ncbi:secretogranin-2b [Kryptolebias marmoratus]|uniref:Secretogranin II b n=1 Tax=Kryptolebias marmoratus TaxID=37003 RepID=A0A3Q3BF12_KRYMA|nr:secretogranin-2b [Kryptolebias marmoratus]
MLHFHHKLPAGGAVLLLAFLLHGCAVQAASLPHHWLRGGGSEGQPAAFQPSSDMIKALEYIENLKQRNGGRPEPVDYDEVEKFKVLLQLASRQDEVPGDRQPAPSIQRPDVTAEQLMKAMLRTLQDQGGREAGFPPSASEPRSDRRTHRHRAKEMPGSAPVDYGNFPRPHKKYPLMFEDEENADASKRATEDLDEQYTPQSLANLRSIFDELGRMPSMPAQKRDVFGDDDDEEEEDAEEDGNGFSQRNQAYEDVAGGEEWVPMEEREETEELVNRSHEEMDRALSDQEEESEREETQRRADQNQEDADDDTKLVDYYLLKVLEMSDQTQKRDQTGEQKKRLIRPSIVDPRTVKELLELSLKLHVPPQDLIDMLLTEELRKLHRDPQALTRYTAASQTPKIRYFSRRLPLKSKPPTDDMDREDFLDIIGVETISNEYPVVQRPMKTTSSADRIPVVSSSAGNAGPVKIPPPSGRRENLFLSELNKMPLKRQTDAAADDDDDDGDVEDEVTTYLAAKILTEYPNTISKRDTHAQLKGQFPYELYERAVKDYMEQAETETRPRAKRDPEGATEEKVTPTEVQQEREEMAAKTSAPQTVDEGEEAQRREKKAAGM